MKFSLRWLKYRIRVVPIRFGMAATLVSAALVLTTPVLTTPALATPASASAMGKYADHPKANAFVDSMQELGFDREELQTLLASAVYKERIIELMTTPAEAKPWKDYPLRIGIPQRAKQGREFIAEHRDAFARAQSIYGVPPSIIAAVIGVETRYGRNKGGWRVVDALTTLAFDYPRRSPFFTKELRELLILTRDEAVDPLSLKGSYAGAMGYGQFMPSSVRAYAIDFDGDSHIDIWNNATDAIGSVANYFHAHGWKQGATIVLPAALSPDADNAAIEPMLVKKRKHLKPTRTLAQIVAAGVVLTDKDSAPASKDQPATLMRLEGEQGSEFWIGLHNFYVITRYNHSALYGMAVYLLSQELAKG